MMSWRGVSCKMGYRISANSFRGNYSFLKVEVRKVFKGGNYSKEETIDFLVFSKHLIWIVSAETIRGNTVFTLIYTFIPDVTEGDDFQDFTALVMNVNAHTNKMVAKQILRKNIIFIVL